MYILKLPRTRRVLVTDEFNKKRKRGNRKQLEKYGKQRHTHRQINEWNIYRNETKTSKNSG